MAYFLQPGMGELLVYAEKLAVVDLAERWEQEQLWAEEWAKGKLADPVHVRAWPHPLKKGFVVVESLSRWPLDGVR